MSRSRAGGDRRRPGAVPESVRAVAWAAATATLVVRWPFLARRMWDHDSVQFALGVLDFDLAAHHPHPPGYPLYLAMLKLLHGVGVEPLAGMLALSLVASALGAAAFTLVAARLAAPALEGTTPGGAAVGGAPPARPSEAASLSAAVLAGSLFAFNPLLWFYAELPLVYAVEGGLTAVLAWTALRMADGLRPFLAACALFALAGGVRPSTLALLFPLFLYGLWRAWRDGDFLTAGRVAAGAGVGLACVAAWWVPLMVAAGGPAAYREISGDHFTALLPVTSVLYGAGWGAVAHNLEVLLKWAVQGTVPALALVLTAWGTALVAGRRGRVVAGLRTATRRLPWLLAWALPPVLFFVLFHVTKAGYTLIHLVPLLAAAVLLAVPAVVGEGGGAEAGPSGANTLAWVRRLFLVAFVPVLVGTALFLFGQERRVDHPRWFAAVLHEHNAHAIVAYQQDLDALLVALERFPPSNTLLAAVELAGTGGAGADGFLYPYHRHLQWYAPQYPVALLVPEQGFALVTPGSRQDFERVEGAVEVDSTTTTVVFVVAAPGAGDRLPLPPAEVVLANDTFRVLAVPFRGELAVGGSLRLVAAGGVDASEPGAVLSGGW